MRKISSILITSVVNHFVSGKFRFSLLRNYFSLSRCFVLSKILSYLFLQLHSYWIDKSLDVKRWFLRINKTIFLHFAFWLAMKWSHCLVLHCKRYKCFFISKNIKYKEKLRYFYQTSLLSFISNDIV